MAEDFDLLGLEGLSTASNNQRLNFIHYNSFLWDYMVHKNSENDVRALETVNSTTRYSSSSSNPRKRKKEIVNKKIKSDGQYHLFGVGKIVYFLIIAKITLMVSLFVFGNHRYSYANITGSDLRPNSNDGSQQDISLLLDFSSNSNIYASNILTDCFGSKTAPIERLRDKKDSTKVDFFTAKSLCDIPKSMKWHEDFRVYIFMPNPIISIVEKYKNAKKVNGNKNKRQLSMKEYLLSSEKNAFTKSIVCKSDDKELTNNDFDVAKRFLKDKSHIGLVNYYTSAMKMFEAKLGHKYEASTEKCIHAHINDIVLKEASSIDESMTGYSIEQMYLSNTHDFNLYAEYINAVEH